jgi:hypothetical protein
VRKANDLCRQNPLASLHVTRGPRFLFHPAFLFNQFGPQSFELKSVSVGQLAARSCAAMLDKVLFWTAGCATPAHNCKSALSEEDHSYRTDSQYKKVSKRPERST